MQDFLNTPNLANFKRNEVSLNNNDSKNTFGGYATDEYGFMGEEFLKATNLPSDYKIHKNALQAIYDVSTIPIAREGSRDDIHPIYDSIDIIAGISYAYEELQDLTQGKFNSKESYSENEIQQMFKNDALWNFNFPLNTPLMRDYKNKKGEFQREGIMLMYALTYDTFAKAESPYTKLSEYGKFSKGMPSSYSPSETNDSNKKPKTPE
ncbi:hypothetical protein [Helicobacter mesocricetorum]|uniref:hypothetical protein n=1 Tax=Helicobacter mesocricetorum TaxID=87012 RepID=UPI000CF12310|nr:hypothetical protein [Helicobacter mesocricetorum]